MDITDTYEKKVDALDAHVSQFYEWLPWHDGSLAEVPKDPAARKAWLKAQQSPDPDAATRAALEKWYGAERAKGVKDVEAFEICVSRGRTTG